MIYRYSKLLALTALLAVLASPSPLRAETAPAQADTPPQGESSGDEAVEGLTWGIDLLAGATFGQTLFGDPEDDVDPNLQPAGGEITGNERLTFSFTAMPFLAVADFDFAAGITFLRWSDLGTGGSSAVHVAETPFYAAWRGLQFDTLNLRVTPSITLLAPATDTGNIDTTMYGAASFDLETRIHALGWLSAAMSFGIRKNFHESTLAQRDPSVEPSATSVEPAFGALRPTFHAGAHYLRPDLDPAGGVNTSYVPYAGVEVDATLPYAMQLGIGYSIYSLNPYEPSEGNDNPTGLPAGVDNDLPSLQLSAATVDLSYMATMQLVVGMDLATVRRVQSDDNESINFPFWSFDSTLVDESALRIYAEYAF